MKEMSAIAEPPISFVELNAQEESPTWDESAAFLPEFSIEGEDKEWSSKSLGPGFYWIQTGVIITSVRTYNGELIVFQAIFTNVFLSGFESV